MVVTAVNAAGESPASAQVSVTPQAVAPPAPTGVIAVPGNGQATVSWNPSPGATSYNLYRSRTNNVSPSTGYQIKNVTTPYLNTGWVNGTAYYMVVTAVNSFGESAASTMVSVVPTAQTASSATVPATPPLVVAVTSDFSAARVFPNPWRSNLHTGIGMTFDRLTPNSTIKIFSVAGVLSRTLSAPGGSVVWDLKNDSGDRVASGLYIYLITNDQGQKTRGKLAIIR
jgi:hypothetical protein